MQEMVSMGIGSKPFMDIKPSDAAISDRAIDYIMKGSGELFLHILCLCYFFLSFSDSLPLWFLHLHYSACICADSSHSTFTLIRTQKLGS